MTHFDLSSTQENIFDNLFKYYLFSFCFFFPQNNCCSYNRSAYLLSNLPLAFWFCLILLCISITTCDFSSLRYWTSAVTVFFFKFLCLKKNSEHHKLITLLLFIQDDIFVHLQLYFTAISLNFPFFSFLWLLNAFSFWIKIYYEGTLNYGSQSATCYHSLEHSGRHLKQASLIQICFIVFECQQQGTLNLFFQIFLRLQYKRIQLIHILFQCSKYFSGPSLLRIGYVIISGHFQGFPSSGKEKYLEKTNFY